MEGTSLVLYTRYWVTLFKANKILGNYTAKNKTKVGSEHALSTARRAITSTTVLASTTAGTF